MKTGGEKAFPTFPLDRYLGSFLLDTPNISLEANKSAKAEASDAQMQIPRAKVVKNFLDQYVIGQEEAKKALAVAVHNHYVRISSNAKMADKEDKVGIQKSNILIIGNSGSGKTLLAQTIAKFMDVPFVSVDATSFTPTGIVGKDIEDIGELLVNAASGDYDRAEQGVVFIDEIDKIAQASNSTSSANVNGVLGGATQSSLLKLLEGDYLKIKNNNPFSFGSGRELCIKNVLFICGGAFAGIEKLTVKEGINIRRSIGFEAENVKPVDEAADSGAFDYVGTEEIIKYGMMPEIIGRLPVLLKLKALNKNDLKTILTEPKNSIVTQYRKLLSEDGVELEFADDAIELIAQMAIDKKIGARGLRSIVEGIVTNIIYEIPDDTCRRKCTLTANNIRNNTIPDMT
ncbi:MAG: ATP-dependent Clp protease ATP-binding subunit ClpX [Bacteroides sp.]